MSAEADDDRPSDDELDAAARELIARHGAAARQRAEERAAMLERQAAWRAHSTALRLLTAVERLLAVGDPASRPQHSEEPGAMPG